MLKQFLRRNLIQRREKLDLDTFSNNSKQAQKNFITLNEYLNANVVALYFSFQNELDTLEIVKHSIESQKLLTLPFINQNDELQFNRYTFGNTLDTNKYGIAEPKNSELVESHDLFLVPGVAFDLSGYRLGFGKGYYDKYLSRYSGIKVGFCHDFQLVDKIEHEEHDVKMDIVVTEKQIIRF